MKTRHPYLLLSGLAASLAGMAGCILYIKTPYNTLVRWYLSLGPALYKQDTWATQYFNAETKRAGNIHCIASIALFAIIAGILFCAWRRQGKTAQHSIAPGKGLRAIEYFLLFCAVGFWTWGMRLSVPGYDEVFSAVNFASLHPFQAWSYYPLPNNHVLFNVLNSGIFFWAEDKLLTARIISFASYLALTLLLFRWLRRRTSNEAHAALLTLLLLIQFQVWTFSFQGRGYEFYALCAWIALTQMLAYVHAQKRSALGRMSLAAVAGMATVPTFLYVYIALTGYAFLMQAYRKKPDFRFWKYSATVVAGVYLFYLPLFLFSGTDALLKNEWVVQGAGSGLSYLPTALYGMRQAIQHFAGYLVDDRNTFPLLLACLPAAGFFFLKNKKVQRLSLLWLLLCAVLLGTIVYQRRFPFIRNLIAHYSFALCFAALVFYAVFTAIAEKIARPYLTTIATAGLCILLGIHYIRFNRQHVNTDTYMYDAGLRYTTISPVINGFPKEATFGLSDECFYWEYLLTVRGYKAAKGSTGRDAYFIRAKDDALPATMQNGYDSVARIQEYIIYRHK